MNRAQKKPKTEKVEVKEKSLKERLTGPILSKYGDLVLPTTITGTLETGWLAFDYFAPIELGNSLLIYGASQSGKSLIMMKLGAAAQDKGGLFVCFNTEAANRDRTHLEKVVPNLKYDDIVFYQPESIEATIECIHMLVDNFDKDCQVPLFVSIDSISSCATKRELEAEEFKGKDMSGMEIASIWSRALRQLTSKMSKKRIVLCLVSQMRTGGIGSFVTKNVSGGGWAPGFYASTTLLTSGKAFLYQSKPGDPYVAKPVFDMQGKAAQECSMYLEKSRYSSGGAKLSYTIHFDTGISPYSGLIDLLEYKGIVEKSGAWYSYKEHNLGCGKKNVEQFFVENPSVIEEIKKELYKPVVLK